MKTSIVISTFVLGALLASMVTAQMHSEHGHDVPGHMHDQPSGKKVQEGVKVVGHVIDPVCYIRHDSIGKEHKACALECAKQGITLAILEEKTGKIYLLFPEGHGNPNEKVLEYVEERVEVTGTVYTAGGLTGIEVKTIKRAPK